MNPPVELVSSSPLPTQWGDFQCSIYRMGEEEITVISQGDLAQAESPFIRLHSACFTGEVLGSLKCDCKPQLENALQMIDQLGLGAVLYLQQEGRGIGLANKIKAYELQHRLGLDTEEANLHLGFPNDSRDYTFASLVLKAMGVMKVRLNTNNPLKRSFLEQAGIMVDQQLASLSEPNPYNWNYLKTKAEKHGHTNLHQVTSDAESES